MGRKRQPDVSFNLHYPKGPSWRVAIVVALIGFSGAIIAALIVKGILPDALGELMGRTTKDHPRSSASASESAGAGGQAQVRVGRRHVLSVPAPAAGRAGQQLLDVAAGGGRFVAVGWTGTATDGDGVVWLSKEGESWTLTSDPTGAFRDRAGHQKLNGVVATREGIVAVGSDGKAAAVWASEDGQKWAKAPHEAGAFSDGGAQLMRSVAKHDRTLVAVGARGPNGGHEAASWYLSTNGVWRRAAVRSSGSRSDGADEVMRDVAWIEDKLVAVGTARTGAQANYEAAVWTSADGRVWTQLPTTEVDERCTGGGCSGDQAMYSVAWDKRSAVAVGLDGRSGCERHAAVWRSVDNGSTWKRMPAAKALIGKAMRMNAVVPTGGEGYMAVGSQDCEGRQRAAVWVSPDGSNWRLVQAASRRGWEGMAGAALSPGRGAVAGSRGNELATASGLTWRIVLK
jgi:hypothetical protein